MLESPNLRNNDFKNTYPLPLAQGMRSRSREAQQWKRLRLRRASWFFPSAASSDEKQGLLVSRCAAVLTIAQGSQSSVRQWQNISRCSWPGVTTHSWNRSVHAVSAKLTLILTLNPIVRSRSPMERMEWMMGYFWLQKSIFCVLCSWRRYKREERWHRWSVLDFLLQPGRILLNWSHETLYYCLHSCRRCCCTWKTCWSPQIHGWQTLDSFHQITQVPCGFSPPWGQLEVSLTLSSYCKWWKLMPRLHKMP